MSIFERYNEEHLLAYVEEQLDPADAEALNEHLAREPHVRVVLDRMRRERAVLRAMGAPAPPVDFVAELEPQLARPMLIDPAPGAYRRHHRRKTRAQRFTRYALAAGILVAVSAGLWAVSTFVGNPFATTDENRLVRNDGSASTPADAPNGPDQDASSESDGATDQTPWPPPNTIVVHGRPAPIEGGTSADAPRPIRDGNASAREIAAPFALVLASGDLPSAEAMLAAATVESDAEGTPPSDTTLVRNFSMAEARILAQRLAASRGGSTPPEYAAWMGDRRSAIPEAELADRLRRIGADARRLRTERREDDEPWFSAVIAGPEALMPPYAQQLELSGRGATHTLSVPASRLAAVIAELRNRNATSVLRTLPAAGDAEDPRAVTPLLEPGDAAALSRWVDDLRTVRAFLAEISAEDGGDARIILPVRIETPGVNDAPPSHDRRTSGSR